MTERKDIYIKIGEQLKARRLELGFSQSKLGDKVKMEYNTILTIEKGRRGISLATLERLCRGLQLQIKLVKIEPKPDKKQIEEQNFSR